MPTSPKSKSSSAIAQPPQWIKSLYGDISFEELSKFAMLGAVFFCIIGSYWLLRPLKDGLFFAIVGGKEWQPTAKMLSVIVVGAVVVSYQRAVDVLDRVTLFYAITAFFGLSFIGVAIALLHPTIGLTNATPSPDRYFGWIVYFLIETYGSLTVSMFWSFVSSITNSASARRGYAIVVGFGNVGAIVGPLLAVNAESLGMVVLFGVGGWAVLLSTVLLRSFVSMQGGRAGLARARASIEQASGATKEAEEGRAAASSAAPKPKANFTEGLRIIATRPYVTGIFLVSTLYEVIATLTDYQMKVIAASTPEYSSPEGLTSFLGTFGMATNGLALVISLLGSSYLMRRFGVRFCLLAYPTSVALASCMLFLFSSSQPSTLLWMAFAAMVTVKGLSYALQNPAKEILYIPTAPIAVKFKAKSFIDTFGSRGAKAFGSLMTGSVLKGAADASSMMRQGSVMSLAVVSVWLVAAQRVGREFQRLTDFDEIVE
jgi:AAA family ATP:ADP antiporter